MSPIRFFLSATLGIHLMSDCTTKTVAINKRSLILNWLFRMREAYNDLSVIRERGDVYDADFTMGLDGLKNAHKAAQPHIEDDVRHEIDTVLRDFELLFKYWANRDVVSVPQPLPEDGTFSCEYTQEQQLRRQNADFITNQAHVRHAYDMPEYTYELLMIFRRITKVFSRVVAVQDIYIDDDVLAEFITAANDGLIEQMHIEHSLPERAEMLLQARAQLLIHELRLHAPLFEDITTSWIKGHVLLPIIAGRLEAALHARRGKSKPVLWVV